MFYTRIWKQMFHTRIWKRMLHTRIWKWMFYTRIWKRMFHTRIWKRMFRTRIGTLRTCPCWSSKGRQLWCGRRPCPGPAARTAATRRSRPRRTYWRSSRPAPCSRSAPPSWPRSRCGRGCAPSSPAGTPSPSDNTKQHWFTHRCTAALYSSIISLLV